MTEHYYKPVGAGDGMGTVVVDEEGMRVFLAHHPRRQTGTKGQQMTKTRLTPKQRAVLEWLPLDSAIDTFSLETHQELVGLSLLRLVKWREGESFGTFRWHITPAGKQALRDNTK